MSETTKDLPLISVAECGSFEAYANEGTLIDVAGEGVGYSTIQPYDLIRFCRTVAALTAENEQLKAAMAEWAGMSGAVEIAISDLTNQSPWTALDVLRKARTFGDRARAALPSSRETTDGGREIL